MFALSPVAQAQKYRLDYQESVTSTNMVVAEHAKSGDAERLWLVAGEQTQGKGRRGRVWHSPPGNLYASLLLQEDIRPEQAATLGFVAGVSLVEAIAAIAPPVILTTTPLQLKWPNDVLLNGAKLAGILLERLVLPKVDKAAIVIGMGLNVSRAPEAEFYPTTSLRQHGFDVKPAMIFEQLSHFWTQNFILWNHGHGLDAIRKKWLEHAAGLGEEVHILVGEVPVEGIFDTIDAQCQLVVKTKDGHRQTIPAGDVHFGTIRTWRLINS